MKTLLMPKIAHRDAPTRVPTSLPQHGFGNGAGPSLPRAERAVEPRFGHQFSSVRVGSGPQIARRGGTPSWAGPSVDCDNGYQRELFPDYCYPKLYGSPAEDLGNVEDWPEFDPRTSRDLGDVEEWPEYRGG